MFGRAMKEDNNPFFPVCVPEVQMKKCKFLKRRKFEVIGYVEADGWPDRYKEIVFSRPPLFVRVLPNGEIKQNKKFIQDTSFIYSEFIDLDSADTYYNPKEKQTGHQKYLQWKKREAEKRKAQKEN